MEQNRTPGSGASAANRSLIQTARYGLPEGSLATYMASEAAQDAFANGGEAGYLHFVAKHQGLHHVLTDEAAQAAFASGGEAVYSDHVRRERERLFNTRPPSTAVPRMSRPANRKAQSKAAPLLLAQPAASGVDASKRRVTHDTTVNPKAEQAYTSLVLATDAYARVVARQRASGAAALLGGSYVERLSNQVLHPTMYAQAMRDRAEAREARGQYQAQLNEYVKAVGGTDSEKIRTKLDVMTLFERRVLALQLANTMSALAADDSRVTTRLDRLRTRLTETWLKTTRAGRFVMVAAPAAAVGLSAGILSEAGNWPGPVVVLTAAGAVLVGRSIGSGMARTASKYMVAAARGRTYLEQQAEQERLAFAGRYQDPHASPVIAPVQVDVTTAYETLTGRLAEEHARRLRLASAVGAVAAAAAFGVGRLVTGGVQEVVRQQVQVRPSLRPTATYTPTPGPTTTPTPTPTPSPHAINPHQYPWDVAHQLRRGHEWDVIRQAISKFNTRFGAHLHLVNHANGTVWVQNGAHALNSAQQTGFNNFMLQLAGK